MPDQNPDPKRPAQSTPDEPLAHVDLEALLNQASGLTERAVEVIGRSPKPKPAITLDLANPPEGTAVIEQQLEQLDALVAQANAQAAAWATTGDAAAPSAKPAPQTNQPGAVPATAEASSTATTPPEPSRAAAAALETPPAIAGESVPEESPAVPAPPADAAVASTDTGTSPPQQPLSEAEPLDARKPASLSTFLRLLLWPINRPFQRVGDDGRQIAAIVAVITLIAALTLWILPSLHH